MGSSQTKEVAPSKAAILTWPGFWDNLPDEIKLHIISFLPPRDVYSVRLVSSMCNALCDDDMIWRNFFIVKYGSIEVREFARRYFKSEEAPSNAKLSWKGLLHHRKDVSRRWFTDGFKPVITTLYGHDKGVRCARFDADKLVSGGGPDKRLIIWDVDTGELKRKLIDSEGDQHMQSVAFDDSILKNKLFTGGGSDDRTVCLWNLDTDKIERRMLGTLGWIPTMGFDKEKIVAGGEFGEVCIWDLESGTLVKAIPKAHNETVWKLQFDTNKLVTVSHDSFVKIWDLRTYERVAACQSTCGNGVYSVKFDDTKMIAGSKWSIDVWDSRTNKLRHTFTETTDWVLGLDFDNDKLITGGYGNRYCVHIYDLKKMKFVRELADPHLRPIRSLQFSGSRIVTASLDHTVKIWDFNPVKGAKNADAGDPVKIQGKRKKPIL